MGEVQAQQMVVASSGGLAVGHLTMVQGRRLTGAVRLEPRPQQVAGRDGLLERLAGRLGTPGVAARPEVLALCGLGGVGKTTVALEYAHRFASAYSIVWWFHAEDATGLLAQFHELASALDQDELFDRRDPVARVHTALAGSADPWLLVFDNLPDAGRARRWLPPKGPGHVLVTTRDGHWPAPQTLQVDVLALDTAADFLLGRAVEPDAASARAVAEELGRLPLALAQAGGYLAATGRTLGEYLELLRADRARVLERGAPAGHAVPVAATWSLALWELEVGVPAAVSLLRLLAYLAPDDIPVRLLLASRQPLPQSLPQDVARGVQNLRTDPFAVDDALTALRRHSLIGLPSQVVSVHRLVQAVTLSSMTEAERAAWQAAAAALVEAAIPADTSVRPAWPACALLLPHARVVLDQLSAGMWRLISYLGVSGDYATARAAWAEVGAVCVDRLGPLHPRTLTARASLAHLTGQCGRPAEARDMLRDVLSARIRLGGPDDPETLAVKAGLAHWTGHAGAAAAARNLYAELLPVRERVSGPEHPDTLTAKASLARWTGQAGDPVAARDLYAQVLPVRERVSGAEHPDTLTVRADLARWTGQAGDAVAARELYAEVLPVRKRVSGAEHPETLTARANLAQWTGHAGEAALARQMLHELLPVRERVSGREHPDTLNARADLAYWTGRAGDAARARDLFAELLPVRERVSGPGHPKTLGVRANLARWTGQAGDAAAARDLYAALVPMWERVCGTEHPDTLDARAALAYWSGKASP